MTPLIKALVSLTVALILATLLLARMVRERRLAVAGSGESCALEPADSGWQDLGYMRSPADLTLTPNRSCEAPAHPVPHHEDRQSERWRANQSGRPSL